MPRFARRKSYMQSSHIVGPAQPARVTPQPVQAEHPLLTQQHVLGNQAMLHLLQSQGVQARLTVNQPGDRYEREADRVAETVVHTSASQVQRQAHEAEGTVPASPLVAQISPLVQRQTAEQEEETLQAKPLGDRMIQRQVEGEEDEEPVQAKRQPGQTPTAAPSLEGYLSTMRGGGRPLSESARAFFEPRFGYDFSAVRVHTGSTAAQAADSIGAQAFTTGRDVVFGRQVENPEVRVHRQLLAHELTHVVQQDNGARSLAGHQPRSSPRERRVDHR